MAVKKSSSILHLFVRLLALTGLMAVIVGLIAWLAIGEDFVGQIVTIAGGVFVVLGLLMEIPAAMMAVASRRGAAGISVALQVALALMLLIGANAFSFLYSHRFDCTRDGIFTIPENLRQELSQLRGETRIVVLQRHTSFGQTGETKQDNYDAAAERKIVEKVKDLADQFRELGPRFHVEVLDIQEEGYEEKLKAIDQTHPELAEAIKGAPEDSIFFYSSNKAQTEGSAAAPGKLQRLSFHDIAQLDKKASKEANKGNGNLILNYQGPGPVARKILNVEQKKPRVALAVVHELLSFSDSREDRLTMAAAGKVLRANGFETRDIILKKWDEQGPPQATVVTFGISRFETLEEERLEAVSNIKALTKEIEEITAEKKEWEPSVEELNKKWVIVITDEGARLAERKKVEQMQKSGVPIRLVPIDEKIRKRQLQGLETAFTINEIGLKQEEADLKTVEKEQQSLNIEDISEQRRMTDLKAKLQRQLADCDLLILPRQTILDLPRGDSISSKAHRLDDAQFAAIKEFMKSGKPVLFCLGPINEPSRGFDPADLTPDQVENALAELGLEMPKQTILFNVESKSFAERRGALLIMGTSVEVPPVNFEWDYGAGLPDLLQTSRTLTETPHPIRLSLQLASRSVGHSPELDLRLRYPRPLYIKPGKGDDAFDPALFMTVQESWNEDSPFPTKERPTPRFETPKKDDPSKGTVKERRRGPFPIAVAAEVSLPFSWYNDPAKRQRVRFAVIGHGGVFVGKQLSVIQQKLLLDTCNWLVGRDDLLAHREETWQFPRVHFSPTKNLMWILITLVGMPLVFVFLGVCMLLIRHMR